MSEDEITASPFSKYVNREMLSELFPGPITSPSPQTVTNLITLPSEANKKLLKNYLREKLFPASHDIRSVLYKRLIQRVECNKNMFNRMMFETFIQENFPAKRDLSKMPFPSFVEPEIVPLFCLNSQGKEELNKILACIHHNFPQITYSPLLPVAVVMFMLYDNDSSQVFSHVCRLIFANSRYFQYLDTTDAENVASTKVLRDLSERYTSGSHKSLLNLTSSPDEVYGHWLRCLFCGLPLSFIVVLFDMYLLEGYKALYRVSLAILRFYRKSGISSPDNIMQNVFDFVQEIETKVSLETLFRKAFNFKLPSSKEIVKLHRSTLLRYSDVNLIRKTPSRNPWDYLGIVRNVQSEIISETEMSEIYSWIPERIAQLSPKLIFSTNTNGYLLRTFYSLVEGESPTLLLIKTTEDHVIGAYCSSSWDQRGDGSFYFGTGETFIFTLLPQPRMYPWIYLEASNRASNVPKMAESSSSQNHNFSLPHIATQFGNHVTPSRPKSSSPFILPSIVSRDSKNTDSDDVIRSPNHDFSKAKLVEEGYRASRRFSDLPEDIPLTSAIENIFDSSRNFSSSSSSTVSNPGSLNEKVSNDPDIQTSSSLQKAPLDDLFMMADEDGIAIGGGGGGFGIFIDSSLNQGTSDHCKTFNNRPLVPGHHFNCSVVEVFAFDSTVDC